MVPWGSGGISSGSQLRGEELISQERWKDGWPASRPARPEMTDALLPRGCQAAEPAGDGYFRKVGGSVASLGRVGCVHSGLCARGSASRGRFRAGGSPLRCSRSAFSRQSVVGSVPWQPTGMGSSPGRRDGDLALTERGCRGCPAWTPARGYALSRWGAARGPWRPSPASELGVPLKDRSTCNFTKRVKLRLSAFFLLSLFPPPNTRPLSSPFATHCVSSRTL